MHAMDDSPRWSKRRKLNTSKRVVSSSPTKSSLKKTYGQLENPLSHTIRAAMEEETEEEGNILLTKAKALRRKAQTPKLTSNLSPRKNKLAVEKDIYDDIEGALSPTPKRMPRNTPRTSSSLHTSLTTQAQKAATNDHASEEPNEIESSPEGTGTNGIVHRENTSRRASSSPVNGYRQRGSGEETSELVAEALTPLRRPRIAGSVNSSTKKRANKNARTPTLVGRTSRINAEAVKENEVPNNSQENGVNGVASLKLRSLKKRPTSIRSKLAETKDDETVVANLPRSSKKHVHIQDAYAIPNSKDELGNGLPASRTLNAQARRRSNRTDHVGIEDEAAIPSDGEQANSGGPENNIVDDDLMDVDGDSFVGSVLDPTEPSPFNKPISTLKKKDVIPLLQGKLAPGRELNLLKSIIMERITAKRVVPLVGLDIEYKTVYRLIEHTITAGEGNSMLVIGARGSGKTALVNKVLTEISKDNKEDYHVVRLNGFIHTDDKIALREIWRQLGKEMDIEEDGGVGKNYADTLATLLALLSHPSEHTGELTDRVAKAVVFIMDEFDLFATHPRQTLLYNLFDIAQSRKAPIAVLGLTTRIDVANSLEKRVKSRFSHRYVHLSLATSFTSFQELCKASVLIESDQLSIEERALLSCSAPVHTPTKRVRKPANSTKLDIVKEWNDEINVNRHHKYKTQKLIPR